MSYRDYKEFSSGETYHIYNRGNGRMDLFKDEQDYRGFLKRVTILLGRQQEMPKVPFDIHKRQRLRLSVFKPGDFSLHFYCLMPNHFHICLRQNSDASISSLFLRLCSSYAKYFNRKYEHVGHVFQDQFSAVRVTSDRQLVALSAYVHQNPKVAGLVRDPGKWKHSSYIEYVGNTHASLCDAKPVLGNFRNVESYRSFVEDRYRELSARKEIADLLID